MLRRILGLLLIILVIVLTQLSVFGQDEPEADCSSEALANYLNDNLTGIPEDSLEYTYRLGDLYTDFALQCGYQPSIEEIDAQVERTLELVPLSYVIAASSIGSDVDTAMIALEAVNGDSFNGQMLYNGLEMGLDGADLGCSGCHNGEAAPLVEGTYTRVEEQRLLLPEFSDYTIEQYLVESILHPAAYIVPEYADVQMPSNYGGRLDAQQLADLVAYLESQDQLLDEASGDTEGNLLCNDISSVDCDLVLADYEGDATHGQALYEASTQTEYGGLVACASCHTGGVIGPDTVGTWNRIAEERLILPEFEDYTVERYLAEAIFMPDAYVPEGYAAGIMVQSYAEQLSYQDLADIIAYLRETD